jgi:hypothetical protein
VSWDSFVSSRKLPFLATAGKHSGQAHLVASGSVYGDEVEMVVDQKDNNRSTFGLFFLQELKKNVESHLGYGKSVFVPTVSLCNAGVKMFWEPDDRELTKLVIMSMLEIFAELVIEGLAVPGIEFESQV